MTLDTFVDPITRVKAFIASPKDWKNGRPQDAANILSAVQPILSLGKNYLTDLPKMETYDEYMTRIWAHGNETASELLLKESDQTMRAQINTIAEAFNERISEFRTGRNLEEARALCIRMGKAIQGTLQ